MEKEWTFDQPTAEGFYWIEKGINTFEVVKVRKVLFKEDLAVFFFESEGQTNLAHLKGLKWAGPIFPPSTETMKEEINE